MTRQKTGLGKNIYKKIRNCLAGLRTSLVPISTASGKVADENAYVGRTYRDAPNVDGLIFVNTSEELMSGDFARVKVTGSADYDLIGELL